MISEKKEKGFQQGHTIWLGKRHSEESKNKMSLAQIGNDNASGSIRSKETREKMSKAKNGNKNGLGNKANKGRKLSKETREKMSLSRQGKNSHFWKGGKMKDYPENCRIRKSIEYKLWRNACFERDNFTCQKTGISGGELEVHHINNFADFPDKRLNISNGITLSKKVHKDFHKIYGKKNNTKDQLIEFLNCE